MVGNNTRPTRQQDGRATGREAGSARVVALDACTVRLVDAEKVEAVRSRMPLDADVEALSEVFGLLADPARLRLATSLLEAGELCVCDLAAATGLSESAVSHALRLLRARRCVQVRRDGRMAYYRLADSHVRLLLEMALTHADHTEDTDRPAD